MGLTVYHFAENVLSSGSHLSRQRPSIPRSWKVYIVGHDFSFVCTVGWESSWAAAILFWITSAVGFCGSYTQNTIWRRGSFVCFSLDASTLFLQLLNLRARQQQTFDELTRRRNVGTNRRNLRDWCVVCLVQFSNLRQLQLRKKRVCVREGGLSFMFR